MKDTARDDSAIASIDGLSRRTLVRGGVGAGLGLLGWQASSDTPTSVGARSALTASSQGEKTITMGMWQPIPTLNTLMTAETGNVVSASRLVLRGLLFLDEEANPVGDLATEVPTL
jgi:hypothetical protein